MKTKILIILILMAIPFSVYGQNFNKISNITRLDGEQNNTIIGIGLVSGLAGTGDQNDADKIKAELAFLKSMGTELTEADITSKNMAIVVVTAILKPYMKKGQSISVSVSAKGSTKSIKNGQLLTTMLSYPYLGRKRIFALASGSITVDEKSLTTGTAQAVVEEDVPVSYLKAEGEDTIFYLILNDPNFANASTIANDINLLYSSSEEKNETDKPQETKLAKAIDAASVRVKIPPKVIKNNEIVNFIAEIQKIPITDYLSEARVLVNSRTGTVIISGSVTMDAVAIAHNDLVVKIDDQKNPNIQVEKSLANLTGGFNLDALVKSLNQLGVKPKDLVIILQKLHSQGALHAKLEID